MSRRLSCLLVLGLACTASSARADGPVGWRMNGTGRFPDADPPLKWSTEENVVWKTELPDRSHCGPILVRGRIFVSSEPAELICVDAETGEVLWSESNDYSDAFGPEKVAAIEADAEKAKELEKRIKQMRRDLNERKKAGNLTEEQKRAGQEKIRAEQERLKELQAYPPPKRGGSGNSAGTPVSDGERVYVAYAQGLVAAYTLDGEHVWTVHLEASTDGFGHSSSPALVGDKLIVHLQSLTALDTATGKVEWQAKVPKRWGTPLVTTVGNARVIVTPSGSVIDASSGDVLAEKLFSIGHATPVIHDGVVFAIEKKSAAYQLPEAFEGGEMELAPLWTGRGPRSRTFSSVLWHDGLIYNVDERGILAVYDAANGQQVYAERLPFDGGRVYASVTLAGKHLFVSNDRGTTVVFEPGRQYRQVAVNELEGFSGQPIFDGTRMYVRGYKHLWCLGK